MYPLVSFIMYSSFYFTTLRYAGRYKLQMRTSIKQLYDNVGHNTEGSFLRKCFLLFVLLEITMSVQLLLLYTMRRLGTVAFVNSIHLYTYTPNSRQN